MRITISNDRMVVLDEVFSQSAVRQVYDQLLEMDMLPIGFGAVPAERSVWRLHDGVPMQTALSAILPATPELTSIAEGTLGEIAIALRDAAAFAQHIIGKPALDWNSLSLSGFVYKAGDSASLHVDGMTRFTGAVIAYLSPAWKPQWGGHLLVFGESTRLEWLTDAAKFEMGASPPNRLLGPSIVSSDHCPTCIFPVPGRVVFLGSDVPHMVTEVSARAGEMLRVTAAGFFSRRGSNEK